MFTNIANRKLELSSGQVTWSCPSNIAIVKYWGKHGIQIPCNSSLSFTLDSSHTITKLAWSPKKDKQGKVEFLFEGQQNPKFSAKISKYISGLSEYLPHLDNYDFKIDSENTFPHSAGIASSASSMGSLALGIGSLLYKNAGKPIDDEFYESCSHIARIGSGSASRSVYGFASVWGEHTSFAKSSDQFAIEVNRDGVHESFHNLCDSILIISSEEKSVSSRAGHGLMKGHPFADVRYKQATDNLTRLKSSLSIGDWELFSQICEQEAMTLHGLMMNSVPSFVLMKPNTLEAIARVRKFVDMTRVPLTFTLDAGPNLHLLYPAEYKNQVHVFIKDQLSMLCENDRVIHDRVGAGPKTL